MGISGRTQAIVYGVEGTYGTDPASYDTIGMLQGSPTITIDNQIVNVFAGGRINSRAILLGPQVVSGRFDYIVQDGSFINASIGSHDTTSPVTNTSNYIHYGTSEDSTSTESVPVEYECESYTMKMGLINDNLNLTITGCKTNSISMTLPSLEEPFRASVEWIGKLEATDSDEQTVAELVDGPYMYHDKGTINVSGVAKTDVTSVTFNVNNNLKREFGTLPAANERTLTSLHQGPRSITGTIAFNYDTDTEHDLMLAGTELDIDLLLDNEVSPTTGATYRAIFIDAKEAVLHNLADRAYPIDGNPVTETFGFTARKIDCKYYDATNSDPWS